MSLHSELVRNLLGLGWIGVLEPARGRGVFLPGELVESRAEPKNTRPLEDGRTPAAAIGCEPRFLPPADSSVMGRYEFCFIAAQADLRQLMCEWAMERLGSRYRETLRRALPPISC